MLIPTTIGGVILLLVLVEWAIERQKRIALEAKCEDLKREHFKKLSEIYRKTIDHPHEEITDDL